MSPTLPDEITLDIGGCLLQVPLLRSRYGNSWYAFVSAKGGHLRGGIAVPFPDTGLPVTITVEGNKITCKPQHKWDSAARQYLEEYEDFEVKRTAEESVQIRGIPMKARVRVSVRRDGRMNVTARIWPDVPIASTKGAASAHQTSPGNSQRTSNRLAVSEESTLEQAQERLRRRLDRPELD